MASETIRVLHVTEGRSLADQVPEISHPAADRITVMTATTSGEGLQKVADRAFDCVVVDHESDGIAGIELLESIRETRQELPVVFRTDDGSEQLASNAIDADVSAYLHTDETKAQIDRVVNLSEAYWADRERTLELERAADLLAQTERIADVGGWEIHPETREVFWTDHLFELLGVDGDEEPALGEALDIYHDEDRPTVEAAVEAALTKGEPFDIEVRFYRPDDEVGWLHVRGIPKVENGRVETLRGAVKDVTERRGRENVLQKMHDIISDYEAEFDQQVRDLLELGRTELGTQYGTLSKIDGSEYTFEFVASNDDRIEEGDVVPVSATNCEIAASTERTLVLGDVERDAPAETDRAGFTEWGIRCYLGAPVFVDDRVYGTFCFYGTEPRTGQFSEWERTLVDLMSRWVSYECQRQQVTEQLQEQNKQLERFASIVSHDLRNPLSIIDGFVQQSIETGDVDHLLRVQSAIDRMDTLIDDVLLLSRARNAIGDRSVVELSTVVADCWKTVPTEMATLTIKADKPIRADETRIKQLLENIIRNSIEHGGDDVTVTIGDLDDGFYIEDDGPGIPEADRERIFEDGYSSSQDGTGLGLSIVAEIVDAHGWTIDVMGATNGGARFEITGVEMVD